jgi:ribosomal protein S18 acetylase RimI-like enzyme
MPGTALTVKVRLTQSKDHALLALCEPDHPERFKEVALAPGLVKLTADLHGRAVGYLAYGCHNGEITVARLAVAPGYRRRGVGGQLVHAVKAHLRRGRRREAAVAVVSEWDVPACRFFAACGFDSSLARDFFPDGDGIRFEFRRDRDPAELGGEG